MLRKVKHCATYMKESESHFLAVRVKKIPSTENSKEKKIPEYYAVNTAPQDHESFHCN